MLDEIIKATQNGATSVAGGGDTVALLKKFTDLPKAAFHNEYLV